MWLLLACAPPDWSREEALRPAIHRVDTNGDGQISKAEYEKVAFGGPTFADADADRSGGIDVGELDRLLRSQDPIDFRTNSRVQLPNFGAPRGASTTKTSEHGFTWLVLRLLREEILAKDAAAAVPTEAEIAAADAAGGLDTPDARRLLARMEAESRRVGLGFPPSLAVGGP